ncbi:LRR receptor-like serine/threonine-protein kinase ERL1 [Arachis ipaensis]|uniref:LRR receptor-like serine/threonine-protein kinase ERL1 n=1 Tax=Arachis ipaensis TaxID=130454 RepID=UPI000A2B25DE|nr:LRR receptor-like serine/threonine-protein kinase ERL1 [Arachis ipaensis]
MTLLTLANYNFALLVTMVALLFSTTASYVIFLPNVSSSFNNSERYALIQSGWWTTELESQCLSQFALPQSLWDGAYLNLYGMGLTDSIPKEIGTLMKLSYLDLSHNYLNGSELDVVPSHLMFSRLISPRNLLGGRELSTGGPTRATELESQCLSQFGLPQSLWDGAYLNLYGMGLTDSIPKEIGTLTKLSYLDLSHNYLNATELESQCLSQFGLPQSLWDGAYLNLYGMGLTDSISKEIGSKLDVVPSHLMFSRLISPRNLFGGLELSTGGPTSATELESQCISQFGLPQSLWDGAYLNLYGMGLTDSIPK